MKLLIATRNAHKLEEIMALFEGSDLDFVSSADYPEIPDVDEDGDTFEANAVKKAVSLARATGLWSLADDSGLEVDALDGRPGVYSARFAGEPVDYMANNQKLLSMIKDKEKRTARFRCVMALSSPSGRAQTVDGACEGTIVDELRGDQGFGYDPLFVPEGHEKTFAELTQDVKNSMSHRGRALRKAMDAWGAMLADSPSEWPGTA